MWKTLRRESPQRPAQPVAPFADLAGLVEPVFLEHRDELVVHDRGQGRIRTGVGFHVAEVAVSDAEALAERLIIGDHTV